MLDVPLIFLSSHLIFCTSKRTGRACDQCCLKKQSMVQTAPFDSLNLTKNQSSLYHFKHMTSTVFNTPPPNGKSPWCCGWNLSSTFHPLWPGPAQGQGEWGGCLRPPLEEGPKIVFSIFAVWNVRPILLFRWLKKNWGMRRNLPKEHRQRERNDIGRSVCLEMRLPVKMKNASQIKWDGRRMAAMTEAKTRGMVWSESRGCGSAKV